MQPTVFSLSFRLSLHWSNSRIKWRLDHFRWSFDLLAIVGKESLILLLRLRDHFVIDAAQIDLVGVEKTRSEFDWPSYWTS